MAKHNHNSKAGLLVWASVSGTVIILLLVASILLNTVFYDLVCTVLGGRRAVYADNMQALYTADYNSKQEVLNAANSLTERVCEEGFVLLKNKSNALPIKTPESDNSVRDNPRVSVFGKNSVNLSYGGSGSGGADSSDAKDLYDSLQAAGYVTNPVLEAFYRDDSKSGPVRKANSSDLDSGESVGIATAETPQDRYTEEVVASYTEYRDAAIVVITRIGGEGFDLPRNMKGAEGARDEQDHYLQLDANETDLLKAVCEAGFERVIVVINTPSSMELGFLENPDYYAYQEKIDAAVWTGFPGNSGIMALGRILNGQVNPSGRTVDTYVSSLKNDPSWNNFGDNNKVNGDRYTVNGEEVLYYFVDYEENIYVGYKYYETRGVTDGEKWYDEAVVYPFGYGLSYTTFDWEIADASQIENKDISAGETYSITIKVTNTGSVAGKDVVQLYGHAPYLEGGIEKSEVALMDFVKTPLLEPGESAMVELTFDPYYLASYDYLDTNQNGFAGYELEAAHGYALYVSRNAHEKVAEIPFLVSEGIRYSEDPVTGYPVENRYTDQQNVYFNSDLGLETLLSRSDWEGTWPESPTEEQREISAEMLAALKDTSPNNPTDFDSFPAPWYDEKLDEPISLRDMITDDNGALVPIDYDDPRWEDLLSQCSAADLISMISTGAFKTSALETIGKPLTNETDGPAGFTNFMDKSGTYWGTCFYCAETVMASTWNEELIEEVGVMVGNEGVIGADGKGNGLPYSGWYAPGANIHRSAFGGRNSEYYSEDSILSGKMAAAEIRGCRSKGVYCFIKHFALNEQETHRSVTGSSSWATEQAIREIYLKPFELAVKEGGAIGVMSSFNRIGTRWTGGDYRLLTEILRNEWGFRGTVITDFATSSYMNDKQMAYAGGDLKLMTIATSWCDTSDQADMNVVNTCAKNILYTVASSNAMSGEIVGYAMPYWMYALIAVDCLAVLGAAVWGIVTIRRYSKKKKSIS